MKIIAQRKNDHAQTIRQQLNRHRNDNDESLLRNVELNRGINLQDILPHYDPATEAAFKRNQKIAAIICPIGLIGAAWGLLQLKKKLFN